MTSLAGAVWFLDEDNMASDSATKTVSQQRVKAYADTKVALSGGTMTGAALELLCQCMDREVRKNTETDKGDWRPLAFLMTDGSPSDTALYNAMAEEVRRRPFASVIACAAGIKAKHEPLKKQMLKAAVRSNLTKKRINGVSQKRTSKKLTPQIDMNTH